MIQVRGRVRRGRELVLAARPLLRLACYRSHERGWNLTILTYPKFCLDKGESLNRVNSYQATQFRIWATKTLKEFII